MKKIGIITLFYRNHNYGALLQAYALQKFIANNGYFAEHIVIDLENDKKSAYINRVKETIGTKKINYLIRYILYFFRKGLFIKIASLLSKGIRNKSKEYEEFADSIPHSEKVYSKSNIIEVLAIYNMFICGSDVVWHQNQNAFITCLGFVPKGIPKMAYAASVGSQHISNKWISKYKKLVMRIENISVREESIRNELSLYFDNIFQVADPTILLTKNEWDELSDNSKVNEKYILCYLLGNNYEQRNIITKFAKTTKLKLLTLPYSVDDEFRFCDLRFGNKKIVTGNPAKFISLIRNAEVVLTDSFHGIVFSVIYHKKFYALERYSDNNVCDDLNGRIYNFLRDLDLSERIISNNKLKSLSYIQPIDYINAETNLSKIREKSEKFLLNGLKKL